MDGQPDGAAAVSEIAGKPADDLQRKPSRKRRERAAKTDAQDGTEARASGDTPPSVQMVVTAGELHKVLGPFLQSIADATRTSPPSEDEVGSISGALAHGLNHTKLPIGEKSAPWVPFAIVVTVYLVPRAVEGLVRYFDSREKERQEGGIVPPGFQGVEGDTGQVPSLGVRAEG